MRSFEDLREKTTKLDEVSTDKLRDYASAALRDKNKAKADKRWKYAGKAMQKVADRDVKAKHDLKYNKTEAVEEKTLTPAEKKKREEIAKAMERDNPGMDMRKKMAIATWQAKKVAEEAERIDEVDKKALGKHIGTVNGYHIHDMGANYPHKKHRFVAAENDYGWLSHTGPTAKEVKDRAKTLEKSTGLKPKTKAQQDHDDWRDKQKWRIRSGEVRKAVMSRRGVKEEVELDEGIVKPHQMATLKPWSVNVKRAKGTAGEYSQIAKGKDFTVWTGYVGSQKRMPHYVIRDDKLIGSGWTMNSALKDAGLKDKDLTARSKFARGSILNKGMKKENVRTADRKPEIYTDPQGKKRVRMVATDRNIIVKEAKDQSTDRLKMLVRLGLMDKSDMTKIVRSISKMKENKPVSPADRKVLFDLLNELIGMITGDEQMFQKAKKAVREAVDNESKTYDIKEESEHEITVGNYTTKHFHMCGSAIKAMTKHKNVDGAEQLTRMQDEFLKFEKKFMNSEPSDADKAKAETMYNQIMQKAKAAGIEKDVGSYMKMHRDSITKGNPKPGFGRVDQKESAGRSFEAFRGQR